MFFAPASPEFIALCEAQVALVARGLGASLSAVYLAEETIVQGEPKLLPVAVYPKVGEADVEKLREVRSQKPSPPLLSAAATAGEVVLPVEASLPSPLSSQYQVVQPLAFEGEMMGLLVAAREDRPWQERERFQIEQVAQTLAIACLLDRRSGWEEMRQQTRQWQQRREVLHDVLHQLHNPLAALRTFGKLLARRLLPGDKNREAVASIVRESDRLKELLQQLRHAIDEPLDRRPGGTNTAPVPLSEGKGIGVESLPALPSSQLLLQSCWTSEAIEPLLISARAIAAEKQIRLTWQFDRDLPPIRADLKALREVFGNLLDNAVKYTPPGGEVFVEVGDAAEPERDGYQRVAINDTGVGIPSQDLERVFDRRYRGVQAATDIPGTGLGLAIARDLLARMSGDIRARSPTLHPFSNLSPDRPGTTVAIWLPKWKVRAE